MLHGFGADRVIDRDREDFAADGPRYDLLLEAGLVVPVVDEIYPLEKTRVALRHLAVERARGKIVVRL